VTVLNTCFDEQLDVGGFQNAVKLKKAREVLLVKMSKVAKIKIHCLRG
jgi:hypothetical protein